MEAPREHFSAPLTGARLGRYRLGERLGIGGAASVYLALLRGPHDFERVLAVKVVHEHLSESKEFVEMFLDEANLAVRLVHPNIVHSYELGREGPHLFLAMEYLAGQPLSKLLERVRGSAERLPWGLVAWIGARAAEALGHAHALPNDSGERIGLVHRDVSPQNVFLTYDGRVVLIDWGIARAEGRATHTGLGLIKGKLAYMAPEQLLRQPMDHRTDIFALGATLYEAAVGRRPFEAEDEAEAAAMLLEESVPPPESRVPGFPADLSRVLLRALAREPSGRHPDAGQMAKELDRVAGGSGISEPVQELTALLSGLFAREREAAARAVAELRNFKEPQYVATRPAESTVTADPAAMTIRPTPGPSRRWLIATVASAVLILAGAAVVARRDATPAVASARAGSPPAPAPPVSAPLEVRVEPPVDEKPATTASDAPVSVPAIRAKTAPPRTKTAPSSIPQVERTEGAPKAAKPGARAPRKDPLVTEYPF